MADEQTKYISQDDAEQFICDECERPGCPILWGGNCDRIDRLNAIPTADVRPVVRGKWIVDSIATNIFHCSVCGNDAPVEPTGGTEYKSNFCHNCGADMREVVDFDQVKEGCGMTELKCKFEQDEVCVNADCPICADFCPVSYTPGVCRFEDRWREQNESTG